MRSEEPPAQAVAHQLVHCVLEADSAGLTTALETVVDHPTDELRPYVREVVAELIRVASAAVRQSAGPLRDRAAFAIDLRDDDNERVSIDELEPPVRATIRAMLAELNGSSEDASFQLDLVVHGVDRGTGLETVRRALTMTVGLIQWSEQPEPMEGALMATDPVSDGANEADVLEQQAELYPEDVLNAGAADTLEANEADLQEQHQIVPDDEEER